MFFAKRARRLSVCDMFFRLDKHRRNGLSPEKVWNHLNYQPYSFNGIHLWDLIDHIDDNEAGRLADLCYTMLKPKGMLMTTSFDEQSVSRQVNSFVIQDNCRLTLRLQSHIDLPWYYRNIRTLTSLLSAFTSVKSLLYRNGVRELLFCRD
jgi:predicted SAM-dependent methyltransferase